MCPWRGHRRHGFRNSEPWRVSVCLHELRRLVCAVVMALYCCTLPDPLHMISTARLPCVIGTQSVSCEPLNIERKRTACVPASGIKRIVANHSKRIIARTQDTQRRWSWCQPFPVIDGHAFRNGLKTRRVALQYLHTYTLSIAQAIARTEPACVPCVRRY